MRGQHLLFGMVALALLAGFMLIPRSEEHVTMLSRDGRYEEAMRVLLAMRNAGDRRPELLIQATVLGIRQGDVSGALESARTYLEARPADTGAQEIFADLLLRSGQLFEHLEVTDRLVRQRPDAERLARLLALYKHHGRTQEELELLRQFAGTRYVTLAHLERLGALLSSRGEWEEAAHWLGLVDRHAPAAESNARLRLLHVLLESGKIIEAQRNAGRWLVSWRNPYLSGKLILRFAQAGQSSGAAALARLCAERLPESSFQVAGVLTHNAHSDIARELLNRWIDGASTPTGQEVRDYIHASLAAGEMRRPVQKLLELVRAGARTEVLAVFIEEVSYAYGTGTVASLMPVLPDGLLQTRPLLAADFARATGNLQLARWYLDRVDTARLAPHMQERWLSLLRAVSSPRAVLDRMLVLWERGRLPKELAGAMAGEMLSGGHQALHDAIRAALRR